MQARRWLGILAAAAVLLGCAHAETARTDGLRKWVDRSARPAPLRYCRGAMMTATTVVDCEP
ncbi:MAG TPA: hypothetical protein VKU41_21960 [Polyangiaceae bacterium]|nr:hypothetical protein [Polyangiaceae bacterium]